MIHRVDVRMGPGEAETREVIGYDIAANTYLTTFFDNLGQYRFLWGVGTRPRMDFQGATDRATLTVSDRDNAMTAYRERTGDGVHGQDRMHITLTGL